MLGRALRVVLATTLVACGGASLPPLGGRSRVVPAAVSVPSSCDPTRGDAESPRTPTDIEKRMRSALVLPNGDPDLDACRALCRRAMQPGDVLVSCFHARSDVKIGCDGSSCPENEEDKIKRSIFCGDNGRRAGADPVAAQTAMPFVVRQGSEVVVCSLR